MKVKVSLSANFVEMLIRVGRLRYYQRSVPLAIGKALNQWLTDCADSGQSPREFVKTEEFKGTS
jgi:hypothetical protein